MNYNYNSSGLVPSIMHPGDNIFRLQKQSFKTSQLLNHKNYNSQSLTPLNKDPTQSKIKYLENTISQPLLMRKQDQQSPMTPEMQIYSNSIKFSQIAKNQQASLHKSSRKLLEPLSYKKNVELFIPQTINTNHQLSNHISQTDLIHEDTNQHHGSVSSQASNILQQHSNNQSMLVHNKSLELDMRQQPSLYRKQQLRPLNNTQIAKQPRQIVTRHSPPSKNGSLWEGIKAQTNMQRIMNVLEKMHNKNQQSLNQSRESIEPNVSIIENNRKLHNESAPGLASISENVGKRENHSQLKDVSLDNLPPRLPRKQVPIMISDSSNPKYPELSPNRFKVSISPKANQKMLNKDQSYQQSQNKLSEFVDMQIKVKPIIINNNLLIDKKSSNQLPNKDGNGNTPIKNPSILLRSELQNDNSIVKLPQLPKHHKEDSSSMPPQSEYLVLNPPQIQDNEPSFHNPFNNSMAEHTGNSINEYYKDCFPQRASVNSLNKYHKNYQPVTNDSIFPVKNITMVSQEVLNPMINVSHSPLNFNRKQQLKQMMPTESQKEAARRVVKKIAKKKIDESTNPNSVHQGLKIDRSQFIQYENEAKQVLANNNSMKIVAPIQSQVILFSIANPLPPGTADTFNTSQLLRQDTIFLEQAQTPTNLTNFVNGKSDFHNHQSFRQPLLINQISTNEIYHNQTPTKIQYSKYDEKLTKQDTIFNNRSLAIKQIHTHSRSSSKKESYSASQSIFSNTRGLDETHKVSGWETRYQAINKQRGNKKKNMNSNEKQNQYMQKQGNSGTMNTPFSISNVLGETMNLNNQQMSWKNSSREDQVEDQSSLERQQSLT